MQTTPLRPHNGADKTVESTPVHVARELTGAGGIARIMHDGQLYTLRITRQGKLILTK
ncbi:MAG: hemin uptake protein HemP [Pseudomonadota bacterium]